MGLFSNDVALGQHAGMSKRLQGGEWTGQMSSELALS